MTAAANVAFGVGSTVRRGRGSSGAIDLAETAGQAAAVDREIEDLAALIARAGGSAALFGHSSGGVLALEAAAWSLPVTRLAFYESPYIVDDRPRPAADLFGRVRDRLAVDDRAGAVALFMTEAVGVPAPAVEGMRGAPMWPGLEALAHTLPYDLVLNEPGMALPAEKLGGIAVSRPPRLPHLSRDSRPEVTQSHPAHSTREGRRRPDGTPSFILQGGHQP